VQAAEAAAKAEAAKAAAEKNLADLEARAKRAAEVKAAEEKRVADLKKAAEPADVNIALVSTPVLLRIVPSPIALQTASTKVAVAKGNKVEIPITLQRNYGFADAVELKVELPANIAGVTAE